MTVTLSTLAVDRVHVTKVVDAATGLGYSSPFTKHPVADAADLLVLVVSPIGGTLTALVFNLEQSDDNGASWQIAILAWDAVATPVNQFQIAENVLYRLHSTTFTLNTASAVDVNASTTGEDVFLTQSSSANEVLASPDGASGFLSTRVLVNNDIPVLTEAKIPNSLIAVARTIIPATGANSMLHLKANPLTLVAAVTNKELTPFMCSIQYVFNGTGYTIGGGDKLKIGYKGDTTDFLFSIPAAGFVDAAATDDMFHINPIGTIIGAGNPVSETNSKSKDLVIFQDGAGEWSAGDGVLIVMVWYSVQFVG